MSPVEVYDDLDLKSTAALVGAKEVEAIKGSVGGVSFSETGVISGATDLQADKAAIGNVSISPTGAILGASDVQAVQATIGGVGFTGSGSIAGATLTGTLDANNQSITNAGPVTSSGFTGPLNAAGGALSNVSSITSNAGTIGGVAFNGGGRFTAGSMSVTSDFYGGYQALVQTQTNFLAPKGSATPTVSNSFGTGGFRFTLLKPIEVVGVSVGAKSASYRLRIRNYGLYDSTGTLIFGGSIDLQVGYTDTFAAVTLPPGKYVFGADYNNDGPDASSSATKFPPYITDAYPRWNNSYNAFPNTTWSGMSSSVTYGQLMIKIASNAEMLPNTLVSENISLGNSSGIPTYMSGAFPDGQTCEIRTIFGMDIIFDSTNNQLTYRISTTQWLQSAGLAVSGSSLIGGTLKAYSGVVPAISATFFYLNNDPTIPRLAADTLTAVGDRVTMELYPTDAAANGDAGVFELKVFQCNGHKRFVYHYRT